MEHRNKSINNNNDNGKNISPGKIFIHNFDFLESDAAPRLEGSRKSEFKWKFLGAKVAVVSSSSGPARHLK
jgi:hypothetical protein